MKHLKSLTKGLIWIPALLVIFSLALEACAPTAAAAPPAATAPANAATATPAAYGAYGAPAVPSATPAAVPTAIPPTPAAGGAQSGVCCDCGCEPSRSYGSAHSVARRLIRPGCRQSEFRQDTGRGEWHGFVHFRSGSEWAERVRKCGLCIFLAALHAERTSHGWSRPGGNAGYDHPPRWLTAGDLQRHAVVHLCRR